MGPASRHFCISRISTSPHDEQVQVSFIRPIIANWPVIGTRSVRRKACAPHASHKRPGLTPGKAFDAARAVSNAAQRSSRAATRLGNCATVFQIGI